MSNKPPIEVPQGAIRLNTDSQKLEFFAQDRWYEMATDVPTLDGGVRGTFTGGEPSITTTWSLSQFLLEEMEQILVIILLIMQQEIRSQLSSKREDFVEVVNHHQQVTHIILEESMNLHQVEVLLILQI